MIKAIGLACLVLTACYPVFHGTSSLNQGALVMGSKDWKSKDVCLDGAKECVPIIYGPVALTRFYASLGCKDQVVINHYHDGIAIELYPPITVTSGEFVLGVDDPRLDELVRFLGGRRSA